MNELHIDFIKFKIQEFWNKLPKGFTPEQITAIKKDNAHKIAIAFETNMYPAPIMWEMIEYNYVCSKLYQPK